MITDLRAFSFAQELGALAEIASQYGWCEEDRHSKPIGRSEFVRALGIAILLAKEHPRLDWPVPGIHPGGYVCLAYIKEDQTAGLALDLIAGGGGYRWVQNYLGDKRAFQSDSLNDVCEAMRTVFPR